MACTGRRLLNGSSPFKADRKHLHHILIDLGLPVARGNGGGADSRRRLNGGAFLLGGIGAAGWFRGVAEYVMFYVAMAIFAATLVFCTWALRVIDARRRPAV